GQKKAVGWGLIVAIIAGIAVFAYVAGTAGVFQRPEPGLVSGTEKLQLVAGTEKLQLVEGAPGASGVAAAAPASIAGVKIVNHPSSPEIKFSYIPSSKPDRVGYMYQNKTNEPITVRVIEEQIKAGGDIRMSSPPLTLAPKETVETDWQIEYGTTNISIWVEAAK
ncbi:MAG: hypothetical protein V1705_00005, partial [bacterium]